MKVEFSFFPPLLPLQPAMTPVGKCFTAATTSPALWRLLSTATAPPLGSPWYYRWVHHSVRLSSWKTDFMFYCLCSEWDVEAFMSWSWGLFKKASLLYKRYSSKEFQLFMISHRTLLLDLSEETLWLETREKSKAHYFI